LTVGGVTTGTIQVSTHNVSLSYPGTPQSQLVTLSSTIGGTQFAATASTNTGGNWLLVNGGTLLFSQSIFNGAHISLNPPVVAPLDAGTYNGSVTLSNANNGNAITTVPVSLPLAIGGVTTGTIQVSTHNVSFVYPGTPQSQLVTLSSTIGGTLFAATT